MLAHLITGAACLLPHKPLGGMAATEAAVLGGGAAVTHGAAVVHAQGPAQTIADDTTPNLGLVRTRVAILNLNRAQSHAQSHESPPSLMQRAVITQNPTRNLALNRTSHLSQWKKIDMAQNRARDPVSIPSLQSTTGKESHLIVILIPRRRAGPGRVLALVQDHAQSPMKTLTCHPRTSEIRLRPSRPLIPTLVTRWKTCILYRSQSRLPNRNLVPSLILNLTPSLVPSLVPSLILNLVPNHLNVSIICTFFSFLN